MGVGVLLGASLILVLIQAIMLTYLNGECSQTWCSGWLLLVPATACLPTTCRAAFIMGLLPSMHEQG